MSMEEYLKQVEALLTAGRMAPRDVEDAILYCGQRIMDAGPGHEAEAMAELGTPEELARGILAEYRQAMADSRNSGSGLNLALKIVVGVFLSPVIVGAYGLVFGLGVWGSGLCDRRCAFRDRGGGHAAHLPSGHLPEFSGERLCGRRRRPVPLPWRRGLLQAV